MNMLDEIMKSAKGNLYFFLSQEANASNNKSADLMEMIRMAKPVAHLLGRHLNVYGFNPAVGINFVARVLPNGDVLATKMDQPVLPGLAVAEVQGETMKCVLATEDVATILGTLVLAGPPAKPFIKTPAKKRLDDEVAEREAEREGFGPGTDVYNRDEDAKGEMKRLFAKAEGGVKIKIAE